MSTKKLQYESEQFKAAFDVLAVQLVDRESRIRELEHKKGKKENEDMKKIETQEDGSVHLTSESGQLIGHFTSTSDAEAWAKATYGKDEGIVPKEAVKPAPALPREKKEKK